MSSKASEPNDAVETALINRLEGKLKAVITDLPNSLETDEEFLMVTRTVRPAPGPGPNEPLPPEPPPPPPPDSIFERA